MLGIRWGECGAAGGSSVNLPLVIEPTAPDPVIHAAATVVAGELRPPRPTWVSLQQARRLDPLAALAVAAVDRVPRATLMPMSAVVVGTAWGSVTSTLGFMDGIAQWGDAAGSPASFTSSVHHHTAGVLGELLNLHGPTATISCGATSGLAALRWAQGMLATGRAESALVVAVDLPTTWSQRIAADLSQCPFPIGGGATALVLTRGGNGWTIARPGTVAPSMIIDAGGATLAEEATWARRGGNVRRTSVSQHGVWWPTAALGGVPWSATQPVLVREYSDGIATEVMLLPPTIPFAFPDGLPSSVPATVPA